MKRINFLLAAAFAAAFAMPIQPAMAQYQGPQDPNQQYPGQQYPQNPGQQYPQNQYQYQNSGERSSDPYRAGYRAGYLAARRNQRYDDRSYDQDGNREPRVNDSTDDGQR